MRNLSSLVARSVLSAIVTLFACVAGPGLVTAQDKTPNILVIWGDDIGITNISSYTMGLVGYRTPNIGRIAKEGMIFTDYYGEQSCTAGRSSYIMGQSVFRTGLSKVGLPGAEEGMKKEDPTIAVIVGEDHAFLGDPVDVRCAVAEQTHGIGADVGQANVVTPNDENVGLLVLRVCWRHGPNHTKTDKTRYGPKRQRRGFLFHSFLPRYRSLLPN